jgi:hypothetical protein
VIVSQGGEHVMEAWLARGCRQEQEGCAWWSCLYAQLLPKQLTPGHPHRQFATLRRRETRTKRCDHRGKGPTALFGRPDGLASPVPALDKAGL